MLESREGQLNAIFACYGSAVQHAQIFEKSLVDVLIKIESLAKKTSLSASFSSSNIHKKTMGQLLKILKNNVKFSPARILEGLDKAPDIRNFLAHDYFLKRQAKFGTRTGRSQMLVELISMQVLFENHAKIIRGICTAIDQKIEGSDKDQSDQNVVFSVELKFSDEAA